MYIVVQLQRCTCPSLGLCCCHTVSRATVLVRQVLPPFSECLVRIVLDSLNINTTDFSISFPCMCVVVCALSRVQGPHGHPTGPSPKAPLGRLDQKASAYFSSHRCISKVCVL